MADNESWSWSKFVLGFFDGRNYAKAIVLGVCLAVVLTICFSIFTVVKNKFAKPLPIPTQQVGENAGTIITSNSNDSNKATSFQLVSLGGCNGKN